MKNFKKRIERLEKILKPIQPLEVPKDPNAITLGLTFEQRRGVREAWESIQIRTEVLLDEMIREGVIDPSQKEEARRIVYGLVSDTIKKQREEIETDEKITENSR